MTQKVTDPKVIKAIETLQNQGVINPESVVLAAADETSPLHKYFQWEDTEAAHQYRLWQARSLIRVCVRYIGKPGEKLLTRVFVSLSTDRNKDVGYRLVDNVMRIDQHRNQLLLDAFDEWRRFAKKYAALKELSEVFIAMEKAMNVGLSEDDSFDLDLRHG